MYFTFDPGLTVTVNFIFTLREPNVYKPHGFFLGFLATFICFCVAVLFYRYLYFVVNQIKLQSYKVKLLFFGSLIISGFEVKEGELSGVGEQKKAQSQ